MENRTHQRLAAELPPHPGPLRPHPHSLSGILPLRLSPHHLEAFMQLALGCLLLQHLPYRALLTGLPKFSISSFTSRAMQTLRSEVTSFSPSFRRITNLIRSTMTELSFHGISSSCLEKQSKNCKPCLLLSTKLGPSVPVNIGPSMYRVDVVLWAAPERSRGGANR